MNTKPTSQWMFGDGCWFRLPIHLRQRWWAETKYGRHPPSPELSALIAESIPPTPTPSDPPVAPPPPDPGPAVGPGPVAEG